MFRNAEEELAQINKDMIKVQMLGLPGTIALGLGLYGVFGANGNAFHPFLNDINNAYLLVAVGACLSVVEAVWFLKLHRRKNALTKQGNT
ncbi:hypothetical protein [Biformimicrobium ophioploci]|uniref:Uncharacterized protein n=1 Tax=Biformimicrobium ophioploci TaxID=3036711 RepID=A0ABQ6M382_9GAMM|nr:hypothetical protein [Microbulbifer sp. NKW57]GMG88759.1 hypothetical protein MNKW57_30800 [Microbulbifer sp. NKW57]